ncbi:endolysin [Acinetobacter phage Acj9]|uniref:Putative N-acetylmuramoyl-L-alanine amidase n=1 Tax=Acinetobacter phage Acj9 TaxID=760939 RepID=E5EPF0_9CAUD|nr:endolysin [Acinetobacter phage Acj9]ADG59916.1 putative N-acetylmuramoyl-L-alanine amidase [Acinetobacter phage Acj9]
MTTFTITAGHGAGDPGALGFGRREADIAVDMRNMVTFYLERDGFKVINDGDGKENKSLTEAIKLINKSDIAVEFHCNASANATAQGVETLAKTQHAKLAKDISQAITGVTGWKLRREDGWYKDANEHSRLGFVRNGGLIVELFFITNAAELKIWDEKKWLIAKAVAAVLAKA